MKRSKVAIRRALSLLSVVLFLLPSQMTALDPHTLLSQFGHTAWRVPDGLLGSPSAITQTKDGYIWISTTHGLVRFDGVKFTDWTPPAGQHLISRSVQALLGSRDGSLWLGTPDGLSRYKDGRLTNYTTPDVSYGVTGILEDHAGTVWIVRYNISDKTGPLCRAKEASLECYGVKDGLPASYGLGQIAEDSSGNIWFGCQRLCRWGHGSSTTYFDEQLHTPAGDGVESVAVGASGEVWAAIDGRGPKLGIQQFSNGKWASFVAPGLDGSTLQDATLFVDKSKTLWIGSTSNGLYRVHDGFADHYGTADGLSGKNINDIYEDMEGNVWVCTDRGLDMFREKAVITFSMNEGLSGTDVHAILAVNGDSIWVGSRGGVDVIQAGPYSSIRRQAIPGREVFSMFSDSRGQVWLGIDKKIFVYRHGRFLEAEKPDGSALGKVGDVVAFAEDRKGVIWALNAGASSVGSDQVYLLAIHDQRLRERIPLKNSLTRFLAADRSSGIWTLAINGELMHFVNGRVTDSAKLNKVVNDFALDVDASNAVWASTVRGLYRWSNGQVNVMNSNIGLPCPVVRSMIEDDQASHWLRGSCGIMHISAEEWQRWVESPNTKISPSLLSELDGTQGGTLQTQPASAKTKDGKLWFVGSSFVQMVDPNRSSASAPAPVHIEQLIANHATQEHLDNLELPPLKGELEIDYTALSFKIPQRVLFRYKLEGHDSDWQEAGTRRQAFYNDLPPRRYRFRVIACNSDGVWNYTGTSLDFSILPAYYQTAWFRTLCGAAVLLLLWLLYRLRVGQLQHQFNIGLEAQVNERARVARELHDTLLQSFQGLLLRFQTVLNLLPARPEEAMLRIKGVIEEGSNAIAEGRDAVHELRSAGLATADLALSIRNLAKELVSNLSTGNQPELIVHVEGTPRDLNLIVRDEAYRIAAEALRNAIRHAGAQQIEVEIRYDPERLNLRIRDDGRGIDEDVLEKEHAPGHWGLRGMRERARLIGGSFEIWSKPDAGAEIELKIPATSAYARPLASRWSIFSRTSRS